MSCFTYTTLNKYSVSVSEGEGNCLNEYVVETSFYEFLHGYGHVGDEEPVHKYVLSPSYEMSNVMRKPIFRRFQPGPT